jgi:nitroreductase
MNEKIQALMERRSIKSYKENQISEQELNTVLEAGKFAPSGMAHFKWKFVVVQRGNNMDKLLKQLHEEFGLGENAFYNAPTIIIVFTGKDSCAPVEDGSLAIGNMLNAAHMIDLGSCWINSIPQFFKTERGKKLQEEYHVPSDYNCVGSCIIGYRKGAMPAPIPRSNEIVIRL